VTSISHFHKRLIFLYFIDFYFIFELSRYYILPIETKIKVAHNYLCTPSNTNFDRNLLRSFGDKNCVQTARQEILPD
jgi:hypothetical protein